MPLIYADGSALSRALTPGPESVSWLRWSHEHLRELVTSPLGLTELKRAADRFGPVARSQAARIADEITVRRFSDKAIETASLAAGALAPFQALHLGMCVTDHEIVALATYDRDLARVAAIYDFPLITPGLPDGWYH